MLITLMILTALVTLIFFVVLAVYLLMITDTLDKIGGAGDSYLAKLRLGLRAIEKETSHLPTQVTALNEGLSATAEGLQAVEVNLNKTIEAVLRQERSQQ